MVSAKIVFFDGFCGLCDRFVDFAMARNHNRTLQFAPLQGETAKAYQEKIKSLNSDSIVLIDDFGVYDRSTAVIKICWQLGSIWKLAIVFLLVPKFIRDAAYNLVAKNRYSIWGKRDTCRLPTKEESSTLLP